MISWKIKWTYCCIVSHKIDIFSPTKAPSPLYSPLNHPLTTRHHDNLQHQSQLWNNDRDRDRETDKGRQTHRHNGRETNRRTQRQTHTQTRKQSEQRKESFHSLSFCKYWRNSLWFSGHPPGSVWTHFHCIIPTNNCNPIRAKTHRKKVVSIRTSESILMDFNSVLTMAFNPAITNITMS